MAAKNSCHSESTLTCRRHSARERRDEARKQLATGRDPSVIRKAMEHAQANTFWPASPKNYWSHRKHSSSLAPLRRKRRGLKSACTLTSGVKPIADVTAPQISGVAAEK